MSTHFRTISFMIIISFFSIPYINAREVNRDSPQPESSKSGEIPNTAYLVTQDRPLQAAIYSGIMSLEGKNFQANQVEIVVVGPAIKSLQKGSTLQKEIINGMKKGIRIIACEMAMENAGVKKENLIDGIETVPNGFFEIFKLEQQNYLTVQL
jgi:intracellular sulfur oxidation DsrE/DsrF family protein